MIIKTINTQKVLSPTQITIADYVINPYRGCEFGCLYCYSQENKNIKKHGLAENLGVKINAPEILEKELRLKKPKHVLLGSTTECFQYQELTYKITEKILKILNSHQISYTILTKSHLITEYIPIIKVNPNNKIYFTFNTACQEIASLLEKKTPSLNQRITAIEKILQAKINLCIHSGPFIPYLSSLPDILKALPTNIKELSVELYHNSMGNFSKILETIEESLGQGMSDNIKKIYSSKENYDIFASQLKEQILNLKEKYPIKFFFLAPDYNTFYNTNLNYDQAL